jgi:hypothetical protein
MVDSSYTWIGCPTTITPMTAPNFIQMPNAGSALTCLQACASYERAYVQVMGTGYSCFCSPKSGTTSSGNGQCKVSGSSPAYFAYSHEPNSAAAPSQGYYRRRLMEMNRLQDMYRRQNPYCPAGKVRCAVGAGEEYECLDVQTELGACRIGLWIFSKLCCSRSLVPLGDSC